MTLSDLPILSKYEKVSGLLKDSTISILDTVVNQYSEWDGDPKTSLVVNTLIYKDFEPIKNQELVEGEFKVGNDYLIFMLQSDYQKDFKLPVIAWLVDKLYDINKISEKIINQTYGY